jgi:hypothetical protein
MVFLPLRLCVCHTGWDACRGLGSLPFRCATLQRLAHFECRIIIGPQGRGHTALVSCNVVVMAVFAVIGSEGSNANTLSLRSTLLILRNVSRAFLEEWYH